MSPSLDDFYLEWLYRQVANENLTNRRKTYWSLLRQLYKTEFVWFIPNDDNRVQDGCALRYEFVSISAFRAEEEWLGLGCSVLEMLIALSRRLSFEAGQTPTDWFWEMTGNMGIATADAFYDDVYEMDVTDRLEVFIHRNYQPSGSGGLFPLRYPQRDQREVEIWYQMADYLLENG